MSQPMMVTCLNCGQETPDDEWGDEDRCPACGVQHDDEALPLANTHSSLFPPVDDDDE